MKASAPVALVASALLLAGCYATRIHSGRPAAPGAPALDGALRSAILGEIVEIDAPDKLPMRCPAGWASVESKVTPYGWLLELLGGWFYHASSVTLRCAAGGPEAPAPLAPPPAAPAAQASAPASVTAPPAPSAAPQPIPPAPPPPVQPAPIAPPAGPPH